MKTQYLQLSVIQKWYRDWVLEPHLEGEILAKNLAGAVERAVYISFLLALACPIYGLTIYDHLKAYDPTILFWSNVSLRLLINTTSFLLAGLFLKKIPLSDGKKIILWVFLFSANIHAAAWIYVWPIVLSGKPEVLGLVHAVNVYTFALAFFFIAPPNRYLLWFVPIVTVVFWIPLAIITYLGGDFAIFKVIVSDTVNGMLINCFAASIVNQVRVKALKLELSQKIEAQKFLGSAVSSAIFKNRQDLLERHKKVGFAMCIDIRGFTHLMSTFPESMMSKFLDDYHFSVLGITQKNGGFVHKTSGDGHLIFFGIFNDEPDLSDIPDIEDEERLASKRRNQYYLKKVITTSEEITQCVWNLGMRDLCLNTIRIGIGIDFGPVHVKVLGSDEIKKELDVYGLVVNRATRLEGHAKALAKLFSTSSSLAIMSPEAANFLQNDKSFVSVDISEIPVRDFPDLKTVFVRNFSPTPVENRSRQPVIRSAA